MCPEGVTGLHNRMIYPGCNQSKPVTVATRLRESVITSPAASPKHLASCVQPYGSTTRGCGPVTLTGGCRDSGSRQGFVPEIAHSFDGAPG